MPLKDYSVEYHKYYSIEEIKKIRENTDKEIFVVMNKKFSNEEIDEVKEQIKTLNILKIKGIFYYDLAVLQIKKELNLDIDLVWNNTFMVTNYNTCNCFYDLGVKYGYLSNEITLNEILEINDNTNMDIIVMLLGYPVVAFSKRNLLTNSGFKNEIEVMEPVSGQKYNIRENKEGTVFKYNKIRNNAFCLKKLLDNNLPYIYLIEDDIEHDLFLEGLKITHELIESKISEEKYVKRMRELFGGDTGFLYRQTIYKVTK